MMMMMMIIIIIIIEIIIIISNVKYVDLVARYRSLNQLR